MIRGPLSQIILNPDSGGSPGSNEADVWVGRRGITKNEVMEMWGVHEHSVAPEESKPRMR